MFHRSLWAFVFFTLGLWITRRHLTDFFSLNIKQKLCLFIASALLGLNWAIYLYAVNSNQVVEGSLGYFINPLVNFLLGFIFLGERLPRIRLFAVAFAATGVLWLTFMAGQFPWIGISLGLTFGLYGLIRKVARINPTSALQIESLVLTLAWAVIFYALYPTQSIHGENALDVALLVGTGVATGIPLLWFSKAAIVTPLNVLGFLQFIAPTLQFFLGVYFYKEPFPPHKLIGFSLIWIGVLLLIFELLFLKRRRWMQ